MVDGLLDTSIIIDLLRNYRPAELWFAAVNLRFGVTKIVWMEVIEGTISRRSQREAIRLLNSLVLVPMTLDDIDWALTTLTQVILAHSGIGTEDALIAATSERLQLPMYTRNIKHMRPLLGDLAIQPYQ